VSDSGGSCRIVTGESGGSCNEVNDIGMSYSIRLLLFLSLPALLSGCKSPFQRELRRSMKRRPRLRHRRRRGGRPHQARCYGDRQVGKPVSGSISRTSRFSITACCQDSLLQAYPFRATASVKQLMVVMDCSHERRVSRGSSSSRSRGDCAGGRFVPSERLGRSAFCRRHGMA